MVSWQLVIFAGSTRIPLTRISLKFKSLDPSNCDPDEEEEEECCYHCAAAHYEFLVNSVKYI
jgi:hypothetical protein